MLGLCVGVGYPLIITWNKNLPYSIQHQIATALKTKKTLHIEIVKISIIIYLSHLEAKQSSA